MANKATGRCMCGAVRYELDVKPETFLYCHCRDCQYVSSGGPAAVVIVPRAAFHLTTGKVKGYRVQGESGNHVTRQFCPTCGTAMFSDAEAAPDISIVKVGTLDDASGLKPTAIIWTSAAQPWAYLDPALPHFEKNPPSA